MTNGKVAAAVAGSAGGFAAGPGDGPGQPLGLGGERLFTWFEDGDTAGRIYPWVKTSTTNAAAFDRFIARIGAVITGQGTGIRDRVRPLPESAGKWFHLSADRPNSQGPR
jgi:hypothetical protein